MMDFIGKVRTICCVCRAFLKVTGPATPIRKPDSVARRTWISSPSKEWNTPGRFSSGEWNSCNCFSHISTEAIRALKAFLPCKMTGLLTSEARASCSCKMASCSLVLSNPCNNPTQFRQLPLLGCWGYLEGYELSRIPASCFIGVDPRQHKPCGYRSPMSIAFWTGLQVSARHQYSPISRSPIAL